MARSVTILAAVYQEQGRLADAESLLRESLATRERLFKGDHPDVAEGLTALAGLLRAQGRHTSAAPLLRDALAMCKRLFKGDHLQTARSLNNLAVVLEYQDSWAEAESLYREALAMTRRVVKGDGADAASYANNLGCLLLARGKPGDAAVLHEEVLAVRKRLYAGDHPDVALSMTNLAAAYLEQGRLAAAEPLYKGALDVRKRLFTADHPSVAFALTDRAFLASVRGEFATADTLYRESLGTVRRAVWAFSAQRGEGESLTFLSALPRARDGFLSNARQGRLAPGEVYSAVWASKGDVSRVFEQRHLRARASAGDPALSRALEELATARKSRAELLLAPASSDPATHSKRAADLARLDEAVNRLSTRLAKELPPLARAERLAGATLAAFRAALPADAVVVDFVRYVDFTFDPARPDGEKEKRVPRYAAFVVTRGAVAWADLAPASTVEPAVHAWREAITSGKEIPPTIPAKVRELVWEPVRKELPAPTRTVYVCPDAVLCRVSWVALPGDKPGTVLLDDCAVATIPHLPFLLDKLWPSEPNAGTPERALAVGGVKYDADPAPATVAQRHGDPLVKPGTALRWPQLENTAGEVEGFAGAAGRRKLAVTRFAGDTATAPAVLAELPRASVAHLATHGFFSDPSFRSAFQLDEADYTQVRRGERVERVGRAANNPLVMTGLVFAGANSAKTAGRGIVTGEQLIDLDLSGLELAVLSACETGIGDVADGEGTFGLQRAFHTAGAKNVVASMWKVPDGPTAALMGRFYRNLWERNLAPVEALRQAQLEVYRNPDKIGEWATGFRGPFKEVPATGGTAPQTAPDKNGTTHPLLWAAFTLSGPGR